MSTAFIDLSLDLCKSPDGAPRIISTLYYVFETPTYEVGGFLCQIYSYFRGLFAFFSIMGSICHNVLTGSNVVTLDDDGK